MPDSIEPMTPTQERRALWYMLALLRINAIPEHVGVTFVFSTFVD